MVEIMRSNAAFRREKYEKTAYNNMNHDEVELFYLSMAKIAKRLPKAKEAKLRMEICNRVSQAELDHLLEVETMQQQQPQESNKNKVLSHQNIINHQNKSSLFQRPISRLFVEESNSMSSYSNHSDTSSIINYSNEEPHYSRPPPNNFLQPIFDDTNDTVKSYSNPYEHL
uniref:BESS domain-containing protein n=1 Tax=Schizaphis graminum TaxID=13262 RepID=A0A2S2PUB2_SCHGA